MKIFTVILVFVACVTTAIAADWKGITPLHSTKADVLRILGNSAIDKEGQTFYSGPDAIAVISYQTGTCDSAGGKFGFGWNVPSGVVAVIGVIPKAKFPKETISDSLVTVNPSEGIFEYYTSSSGLQVETLNGQVTLVTYRATDAENQKLHCPVVQTCCWDVFPRFDEFRPTGKLNTRDHILFLLVEIEHFGQRGIFIVLGPNETVRNRRIASLDQQIAPLLKKIKFAPERISIVDGGYQAEEYIKSEEYPIANEINRIRIIRESDPQEIKRSTPKKNTLPRSSTAAAAKLARFGSRTRGASEGIKPRVPTRGM